MTTKFKLALVLASAACFYLSTGLGTVWPLAWIAPIPALYLAFREVPSRAVPPAAGSFPLGWLPARLTAR